MTDYFAHPWFLLLLIFPVGWILWYFLIFPEKRLRIPMSYDPARFQKNNFVFSWMRIIPPVFKTLAMILCIMALARPQAAGELILKDEEGIDILLLLDTSGSMETEDFDPNRLEVAKEVALRFIQGRTHDRIGMVLFAEDAFSYAPLTLDHKLLESLIAQINSGILPKQGTAMGSAIAVGINRMQLTQGLSKVMILVTDGASNRGKIEPITAAQLASDRGIRIYTIGVGMEEFTVAIPGLGVQKQKTDLDEPTLKQIADITGGQFFRAQDPQSLEKVFNQISALEKNISPEENDRTVEDLYPLYLKAGIILLIAALLFQWLAWYNPLEE